MTALAEDFARASHVPAGGPIAIGLIAGLAAVLVLAVILRKPVFVVTVLALSLLALLADALLLMLWTPSYFVRRVIGHVRYLSRNEWLGLGGFALLALGVTVWFLGFDFLVIGPVLALLLATGYFLAVQRPVALARAAVLDRLEPILRAMRLRGAGDAEIARTLALLGVSDWEGLVETLFGHSAVVAARRSSDFRLLHKGPGLANWRERLLEALERRERQRTPTATFVEPAATSTPQGVERSATALSPGDPIQPPAPLGPNAPSQSLPQGVPTLVRRGAPRLFGPDAMLANAVPNTAGAGPWEQHRRPERLGLSVLGCLALLVGPAMRLLVGGLLVLAAVALHDHLVSHLFNSVVDSFLTTANVLFAGGLLLVSSLIQPRLITALFVLGALISGPAAMYVGKAGLDPLSRFDLPQRPWVDRLAERSAELFHNWQILGLPIFFLGALIVLAGCALALIRGLRIA